MKKIVIFAVTCILFGGATCLSRAGFLLPLSLLIFGATPVSVLNGPTAKEVQVNGSVAPFFHAATQSLFAMTCTTKNRRKGHFPRVSRTQSGRAASTPAKKINGLKIAQNQAGVPLNSLASSAILPKSETCNMPPARAKCECRVIPLNNLSHPQSIDALLARHRKDNMRLNWELLESGVKLIRWIMDESAVPDWLQCFAQTQFDLVHNSINQLKPENYEKHL